MIDQTPDHGNPQHPLDGLLLGTAVALVLGGALRRRGRRRRRGRPAYADAVQVEGVQPLSFADVVEKVRPAVVSVRVKSEAAPDVSAPTATTSPFFDLPDGSPMERFFKQFRQGQRGPSTRPARSPTP